MAVPFTKDGFTLYELHHKKLIKISLQWRHNEGDGVSNDRYLQCWLNLVQAYIKGNIKAQSHWPLWGESTGHRRIPLTKGQ